MIADMVIEEAALRKGVSESGIGFRRYSLVVVTFPLFTNQTDRTLAFGS